MDIKSFDVSIKVEVNPIWHSDPPRISYGINNNLRELVIKKNQILNIKSRLPIGKHTLYINFINKLDSDCIPDQKLDKQIHIGKITIDGYSTSKFNHLSEYRPIYPEPWFSQQLTVPPEVHFSPTILGLNGEWSLNFYSPVFPWIHKIEDLGWIWPIDN